MTTMAAPPTAAASAYEFAWGPSPATHSSGRSSPRRITPDFSPPLIAMVAVVGTAFLIVFYARILSRHLRLLRRRWRRWRLRRRLLQSTAAASDLESPPPFGGGGASFGSSSDFFLSPYGLDDAAIKALPVSLFSRTKAKQLAATNRECAVCLLEFEEDDTLRTLPLCAHAFHMDCIDVWLRSHATCPLCRAAVLRHEAAFAPMRAARIRPSLDDILLIDPLPPPPPDPGGAAILPDPDPDPEIAPAAPSPIPAEDRFGPRDFLLKRSYSFGFERSLTAEPMVLDASTASPWRYRHHRGGFWSKRWPSPFGCSSSASRAARVFSFRSYRGAAAAATLAKSPAFFKRRGFFSLSSEPTAGVGPSSRRSRSMTSPSSLFLRPASSSSLVFSSSRIRCGDPEALLSPERLK